MAALNIPPTANPSQPKPPKVAALESRALSLVEAHKGRLLVLARGAFRNDPDPLALFAHEFSKSSAVHVEALLLLQEAHSERLKALDRSRISQEAQRPQAPLPFPDVLSMLGIVPIDRARFRRSAIIAAVAVTCALIGLGVLVGISGVLLWRR